MHERTHAQDNRFVETIACLGQSPLSAAGIEVLQVNLGYRCNMACRHCHVSAGPGRTESMAADTIEAVLRVLRDNPISTLDLTGGAPELNPHFRSLVAQAVRMGKRVMVRTNLTVFSELGMADLPKFYQELRVELIASLPCYLEVNVDAMRGKGAFAKSIEALKALNKRGYGNAAAGLTLNLVYNPVGPFLAPAQLPLEDAYRKELRERYGIVFTHLFALNNMPIGRLQTVLSGSNELEPYLRTLAPAFNPATLPTIMCRSFLNVGWDGTLYDCDFNQVLGLPVRPAGSQHITDFNNTVLSQREIVVGDHCFACTAGHGSSCVGALN